MNQNDETTPDPLYVARAQAQERGAMVDFLERRTYSLHMTIQARDEELARVTMDLLAARARIAELEGQAKPDPARAADSPEGPWANVPEGTPEDRTVDPGRTDQPNPEEPLSQ